MSYVRSGSSPERLYVFESGHGLEFWWTDEKEKQRKAICKPSIFKQFMKKMVKTDGYICSPVRHKNIYIQEVVVNITNPKKYKILTKEMALEQVFDRKIKWHIWVCLKIDKTEILMWPVTWHYFYNTYLNQNYCSTKAHTYM